MSTRELPVSFALREQPGAVSSWLTVVVLGIFGALVGFFAVAVALLELLELLAFVVGIAGALVGAGLAVALALRLKRRVTPAPIEVDENTLRLPRSLTSTKVVELPLDSVLSIELRGNRKATFVVIGSDSGFHAFPTHAFVDEDGAFALRGTLLTAIAARPDGERRLASMGRLEIDGLRAARRRPRVTQVMLGVIAGVFVFELSVGALGDTVALMRWGANTPALVEDGQWWRLFVAGFMHLSWLHVLLNASALLSLGAVVEKLVGPARFVVVALGGSLCGNAASMLTHTHLASAGASSLIFGLIGALLVINLRFRRELPAGFFLGARRWVSLLGINGLVSLLPGVDGLAHLGGLLGGAAIAIALVPRLDLAAPAQRPLDVALASAIAASFVLAFALGGQHALELDEARAERELAWAALDVRTLPLDKVADVALAVARDPASDAELLARAHAAMTAVVAQTPDDAGAVEILEALTRRR